VTQLKTNTITIRGEGYMVSEMTGGVVKQSRKIIESDKARFDMFIAASCSVEPKLTEKQLEELPSIVSEKIAAEAVRLSKEDPTAEKKPDA
jgi:hypothetical protein